MEKFQKKKLFAVILEIILLVFIEIIEILISIKVFDENHSNRFIWF